MSEWIKKKFSEFCDITRGGSPRPIHEFISDHGTPWLKIADATASNSRYINCTKEFIIKEGESKSRIVYPGDLIVSNSATPGIPRFMNIRACIHDGWLLLRGFKDVDTSFLYYLIIKERDGLLIQGNGSIFTNLKTEILKNHEVALPPLSEQKAIAAVLSSLDDKIDLLQRQNKTLEEMAQTLFRQWFIEEAKEDWKEGTLGNVSVNIRNSINPTNISANSFYVGLEHIDRKCIALYKHGFSEDINSNKYMFKENHLLFGKLRPYFHKVCFAPFSGVCSTDILVIEPKERKYFGYCLFSYFQEEVVEYANIGSNGTRMPRTNWDTLKQYPIFIPDDEILNKFNLIIESMIKKIKSNIHQIRTLETLRDTLLPKLMSGEVRVCYEQLPVQIEATQPIAIEPFFPWFKNEWLAILEVVYRISKQPYANPIGQTIFQKVSYVITEETGLPLRLDFAQGDFGPFSKQISPVLKKLSQVNMIQKQSLGKMDEILLTREFEQQREKFLSYLTQFEENIQKTVDLFCRIKNTEQAEEIATILYSARQLKNNHPKLKISEQQVLDYVLDWKPKWQEASKLEAVGSAIRNLGGLGWLELEYCASLPGEPL